MQAEDASANSRNTLPELGLPNERPGTITPNAQGVILDNRFDGKRLVVSPEYSDQNGLSLGGAFAFPLGENAAGGLLLNAGAEKNSLLFNAGVQMSEAQRLIFTLGQQRQYLNFGFASGWEKAAMTQNSVAASYQFRLARGLLDNAEINAYLANTPSRDLADKSYAVDTAALYELWSDPRRVAGGSISGLQARLAFTPTPGGTLKLGAGGEQQEFDHLTGKQRTTRATGSAEWRQQLAGDYQLSAGIDAAVQNRYTLGLTHPFGAGWLFGVNLVGIRGRDGAPDDNQVQLTWSYDFSGRRASSAGVGNPRADGGNAAPAWGSLLDQVVQRPGFLPAQVVAKLDTTAVPVRQISVNKAALPAGASVNTATGVVTNPLVVAVTGIAGVTLNGAPFANTGQFSLVGNNLNIDPGKITQPAVGVIDTYVVTVNNLGGGTTLVTVVVSRGSVKIDSITVSAGAAADTIAPTTTAAPTVSATTDTATTLSVTINENGTGYYLVQPAAAAAPTVAAVQAGTAFAMTANVAATQAIGGLTATTAYTIYFVAKDAANNAQAAVQSVAVTTMATVDVTVPVATADSTTTLFNTAKTAIDVLANDTDNSGAAPTLTGVLSNQVGGVFTVNAGKIDFTPTAGFSGAASVTYEIADASNNKSTGVLTVTVGADITAPVATADSTTTLFNTAKTAIDVLANDTDNSGVAPTLTGVLSNPVGGVFTVNAGKIDFTPTAGFSGVASVTYEITDAANNKSTGVLTVTVGADATAPVATADSTTTLFNTAKTAIDVLANDTDNSGAAPTLTGVLSNQVGGVFTVNAGKIDFTPTAGFSGAASVTYEIADAANNKSTGVLTVTVGGDITVPIATADNTTTLFNTAKTAINVLANDTDNSGAAPTLTGVLSNQVGGVFTVNAGKIDFTPTAGFSGAASVTYEIADAANNKSTGVLTITVGGDVTAPTTTVGPSVSGTTDTATTLSVTIDENGTGYYLVQAAAAVAPSVATVQTSGTSFAMTANVAATPAIGGLTAGTAYTIYFVAKDAANNVQAAVQSVAVTTNALPTANNFTYGTNIDNTAKTFDWKVLSAAADADGDPLTASVQAQGAKGAFAVAGNNVTYTPSANQTVSDSGTLRISDGRGGTVDITVTVNGIDTAPPGVPSGVVLDAGAVSTTSASVALNNFTDPMDADLAAWFVSESGSAPAAGDAGWSSTKPTSYTFATATNETKTVCVYVKDTLGNVQPVGACDTINKVTAAAVPTASAVSISGTAQVGQTLTGSYTYADANSDPEGTSTFRWLRNGVAIAGATASTYQLVNADNGATIAFEVTPVSTVAPTTGTAVASSATAAVTLPAGYVSQGGLVWSNNTTGPAQWGTPGYGEWNTANTYCSTATLLGQTGWRLPTQAELSALYSSGAMNGQGWALGETWSSTPFSAFEYYTVFLDFGGVSWGPDTAWGGYVTCVR